MKRIKLFFWDIAIYTLTESIWVRKLVRETYWILKGKKPTNKSITMTVG